MPIGMQASAALDRTIRDRIDPEEWRQRVDLAACYRLAAHHRMTDQIYPHISARVPGAEEHFLINAFGTLFEEVTASSLVKIDVHGNVIDDPTGLGVNRAGFLIHAAVHKARPDVLCVMHTHTAAGIGVSAQEQGLLPISQHAMRFWKRIGYHDYEGIVLDEAEQERLIRDLGQHQAMILRNHGLLACGRSVRDAFEIMYYLERACQAQISALAGGSKIVIPPEEVIEKTARQFERPNRPPTERDWPALIRLLDRLDPSYRQ
jgi:ribulose-5-phosphate 4-epimerase/fuculose-1-phosphate aldolase